MNVIIIAVGKPHNSELQKLFSDYEKRLKPYFDLEWRLLPSSQHTNQELIKKQESEQILNALSTHDHMVLLDETGEQYNNHELSARLEQWLSTRSRLVLVIGGAFGVSKAVFTRADAVWSVSRLVFPHQIMRVLVLEQLYRSQMIKLGHPYHHT